MQEFLISELLWPQISCGCVAGEEFLFPAANYNGIFSLNLQTGQIVFKAYFAKEEYAAAYLSSACLCSGKKVFFAPDSGSYFQLYDMEACKVKLLESELEGSHGSYSRMIQHGTKIYGFPITGENMQILDIESEEVESVYNIADKFRESFQKQFHIFSDSNLFLYKENIYGAMWEEPVIYRFDVKRKKISFIQLPDSKDGFVQMAGRDGKLFLLGKEPILLVYDIEQERTVDAIHIASDRGTVNFRNGYVLDDFLHFYSYADNLFLKIDIGSKKPQVSSIEKEWGIATEHGERYRSILVGNYASPVFISNKGKIVWTNKEGDCVRSQNISYRSDYKWVQTYHKNCRLIFNESCFIGLKKFLDYGSYGSDCGSMPIGDIGRKVWMDSYIGGR